MSETGNDQPVASGGPEIVSKRVFAAPRLLVYQAFSDPGILAKWWGPRGFTNTFQEFDFRAGGAWRFVMRGPDGTEYPIAKAFVAVVLPERISLQNLEPTHRFLVTMTFAEEADQTRLTWIMRFESAQEAQQVREAVIAANEQNFDRLAAQLTAMA